MRLIAARLPLVSGPVMPQNQQLIVGPVPGQHKELNDGTTKEWNFSYRLD